MIILRLSWYHNKSAQRAKAVMPTDEVIEEAEFEHGVIGTGIFISGPPGVTTNKYRVFE